VIILVDYNQVILASLFSSIGNHYNVEIEENLIRHMFLNSLRVNRKKFFNDFGEIVICTDGKNSWRREVFPYYKAGRRKSREESELDWNELFRIINVIRNELIEYFPYKVIYIDHCEADDIIGTIIEKYGTKLNTSNSEQFLILSGDKDYIQLHKYANVKQYDPVRKKWIENSNPDKYLMEHILRGDTGDGIPNVLSSDNSIVIGERQKAMTSKRMAELMKGPEYMDELTLLRFHRNKMMIDLSEVPQKYKDQILEEYNKDKKVGRSQLFNFFVEKRLKNLIADIGDF
jgi:5'-3' exonuclease